MKDYKVGLYLRLSRDDKNSDSVSMSISNQRDMLVDYVEERGWQVENIYIDDGISGTTFERPSFKRMIADIEKKRINMVICKDLSRLGRNYVRVGEYTDFFFPRHKVRFIAVNENIGTQAASINTNGNLNTYTYKIKFWAIIDALDQAGWDYNGSVDFTIELDY